MPKDDTLWTDEIMSDVDRGIVPCSPDLVHRLFNAYLETRARYAEEKLHPDQHEDFDLLYVDGDAFELVLNKAGITGELRNQYKDRVIKICEFLKVFWDELGEAGLIIPKPEGLEFSPSLMTELARLPYDSTLVYEYRGSQHSSLTFDLEAVLGNAIRDEKRRSSVH